MEINIKIFYTTHGCRSLQQASFTVNAKRFKVDPLKEAATTAFKWWENIKRNKSYHAELETVKVNDDQDITERVKQLDAAPIPDLNLPF